MVFLDVVGGPWMGGRERVWVEVMRRRREMMRSGMVWGDIFLIELMSVG